MYLRIRLLCVNKTWFYRRRNHNTTWMVLHLLFNLHLLANPIWCPAKITSGFRAIKCNLATLLLWRQQHRILLLCKLFDLCATQSAPRMSWMFRKLPKALYPQQISQNIHRFPSSIWPLYLKEKFNTRFFQTHRCLLVLCRRLLYQRHKIFGDPGLMKDK